MSANRNRGGKRAYLKHTVSRHDPNPNGTLRDAIGLGRDINPVVALPKRAIVWLDKNKHTPTMTEPMKERVESWRVAVKERKEPYTQIWVDAGNYVLKAVFTTLDDNAIYFFIEINKTLNRVRRSLTMSKRTALALRENGLKGIPWKE